MSLDTWWAAGRYVDGVFVHDAGDGPLVTMLHGYPGSSYDFHRVVDELHGFRTFAPDLLGFGRSPKPRSHRYSIHEQADVVEQLWREIDMTATVLVAHDYSTSIAQELLARDTTGITGVVLLNGAVFPHLHRPTTGQQLLLSADGPALAAAIDETTFSTALRETFASVTDQDLSDLWRAMSQDDGHQLAPDLLHYIADRSEHGERWVAAMESTSLPLSFVWGLLDPVSGAHVLDEIRRRLPDADRRGLPDVGHWPPIEAPAEVARAVRDLASEQSR